MVINYEQQRIAQQEMNPDEKLLWVGQPDPKRGLLPALPIVLFGIPWTAFAIFWVLTAASIGSHARGPGDMFRLFPLFGVPFILIGLGMLSSPYWMYRKAGQTIYAVSDKRVLIIVNGRSRSVKTYDRHNIGDIQRTERADGTGDLIFAQRVNKSTDSGGFSSTGVYRIGFFGIPDVHSVETLVREITAKS